MTADVFLAVFEKWGLSGVLLLAIVVLFYLLFKYKAAFSEEVGLLKDGLDDKNGTCKFHRDYQVDTDRRLDKIEKADVQTERDLKTVFKKLDAMDDKLDTLIMHFAQKAIGGGT